MLAPQWMWLILLLTHCKGQSTPNDAPTTRDPAAAAARIISMMGKHSDLRVRPNFAGAPVNVTMNAFISNVYAENENSPDITLTFYLRAQWTDPRLSYNHQNFAMWSDDLKSVTLGPEIAQKLIWRPDIFIPTSKASSVSGPLRPDWGVRVGSDGSVHMSSRQTVTIHCGMDLSSFPYDHQQCELAFESYMGSVEDMSLNWKHQNSDLNAKIAEKGRHFFAFKVTEVSTLKSSMALSKGQYERLSIMVSLSRVSAHYTAVSVVPLLLVTALTTLLFWMPVTALAERAFFGGFLFLSTAVSVAAAQYGTPQVGYLKALDVWCVSCLVFVFVAVFEVILLNLLRDHHGNGTNTFELMADDHSTVPASERDSTKLIVRYFVSDRFVTGLDWGLRILYPVAYLVFNIVFWSIY